VIVVIPLSGADCNSLREQAEWLPRQCPACRQMAVIGNGRRLRSAYDGEHDRIRVRRGRCKCCGHTVTVLPVRCIPGGWYGLIARQQAIERIAAGTAVEQAAPDCLDPNRIADPSTVRRWCWRRIESLACVLCAFVLCEVTTLFAWDWRAAVRILIPEPNPL
jgi:hypothetical protein